MAFEIEVPINVKDAEAKSIGDKIAERITRSLKSIGLGGGGAQQKTMESSAITGGSGGTNIGTSKGGGKSLLKSLGVLGAILGVLDGLDFVIKPVMALVKAMMVLLFMPLVPILKPLLKNWGNFMKKMAPVMRGISNWLTKLMSNPLGVLKGLFEGISNFAIEALTGAWEMIKSAGQWLWDNIILKGFELLHNVGKWIWDQILLPAFSFLGDVGVRIWDEILLPAFLVLGDLGERIWTQIKSLFVSTIDAVEKVWEFMKTLFKGSIDAVSSVWSFIKSLFRGSIDVGGQVWNFISGLFSGSSDQGGATGMQDGIITPSGQIVKTDPRDYIIATKNPGALMGGGMTLNINNPVVRSDQDIKQIAREVSRIFNSQLNGRIGQ